MEVEGESECLAPSTSCSNKTEWLKARRQEHRIADSRNTNIEEDTEAEQKALGWVGDGVGLALGGLWEVPPGFGWLVSRRCLESVVCPFFLALRLPFRPFAIFAHDVDVCLEHDGECNGSQTCCFIMRVPPPPPKKDRQLFRTATGTGRLCSRSIAAARLLPALEL